MPNNLKAAIFLREENPFFSYLKEGFNHPCVDGVEIGSLLIFKGIESILCDSEPFALDLNDYVFVGKKEKKTHENNEYQFYCLIVYDKKMAKELFKVYNEVFDNRTLRVLEKFRNEYFDEIEYCISTGKEANVFRASTKTGFVAVKIFRTYTSSFDKMTDYIIGDPRFKAIKKKKHEIVNVWCKKEFRNLSKAYESGVSVPKPMAFKNNVLVMEFIGENSIPSRLIKDIIINNPQEYYDKIIINVKKLYKANLIHADLSEFNILDYKNKPVLIDMGQSVLKEHPNSMIFLKKDIHNINKFFEKKAKIINFEEFKKQANQ